MEDKVSQIRSILRSDATTEEEQKAIVSKLMTESMYSDYDEGYLRALLFPEYSPAVRIPTPFGVPSTLVTQRVTFYLNTGLGDGFINFVPQDITNVCCFKSMSGISSDTVNFPVWNGKNTNLHCCIPIVESKIDNIINAFTALRLVGASMRIGYTGTVDQEQGFLVASHVYDKRICELSEKAIEEGFYVTRTRPSDGIRLVYQPKDDLDMVFQECNRRWDVNASTTLTETFTQAGVNQVNSVYGLSPSAILMGGVSANDQLDEIVDYRQYVWMLQSNMANASQYASPVANVLNWQQLGAGGLVPGSQSKVIPLEGMIGMGSRIDQGACPQQLVCYWKGLPEMQECLRVDIVRHFEAIPRTAIKDLVAVARPNGSEETIKIATKLGPAAPVLQSSTLNASDQIQDVGNAVIAQGGQAKGLAGKLARHLNPGNWKGPIGELGRQGIVAGTAMVLGPGSVPFTEAGMSLLKKTSAGSGGAGGRVQSYNGNSADVTSHPLLNMFKHK